MADWINITLPVCSLIAGSLLTMASQALNDKRAAARERTARREQFEAMNFEMHRTAMLEMQEIVLRFSDVVSKEKRRRIDSGYYDYWDSRPYGRVSSKRADEFMQFLEGAPRDISTMDEARRKEFESELQSQAKAITEYAQEMRSITESSTDVMNARLPFSQEFVYFMHELRLRMYRSGSNSVVSRGENLIQAVAAWNGRLISEGTQELYRNFLSARNELNRALSNALTFGPYDIYGDKDGSAD